MEAKLQERINARREAAHNFTLEAIAMGASRDETMQYVRNQFPFSRTDIWYITNDALRAAQDQGVEREDIHSSWFRR